MTATGTVISHTPPVVSVSISDAFDGGNIQFIEQRVSNSNNNSNNDVDVESAMIEVILHIKPDVYTELERIAHMQYFSFRVTLNETSSTSTTNQQKIKIKYIIANADKVSYPEAWTGTTVFYSHNVTDADSWKRNRDTFYTQGNLTWEHTHTSSNESLYFSYFPPYSYDRHLSFLSQCTSKIDSSISNSNSNSNNNSNNMMDGAKVMSLGQSLEGREIDCVKVGTGDLVCWIIHRQHPGESMAEHYAEGLLTRLLGLDNATDDNNVDDKETTNNKLINTQRALELYTFYIVPCMCPDGAIKGHLRTNACGANLNREWATVKDHYVAPSLERSPEVYHVLQQMDATSVDCFLDIHGDEELPYNFLSGANFVPKWSTRLEALHGAFTASYSRTNSDMQQRIGYPPRECVEDVLPYMNVGTNQVANRFDCLSVTLEMPFKDCQSNPNPDFGWNPKRSRQLGASVVEALLYVQPYLRATGDFWTALPVEDTYVVTTDDYPNENKPTDDSDLDGGFKMLKKRFYSDVHEIRKVLQ